MVVDRIVCAPHPRVGGHRQQQLSTRLQQAENRGERRPVVRDMLKHVEQRDEVEGLVELESDIGQFSGAHRAAKALGGERAGVFVKFNSLQRAVTAEHLKVMTRSAADLQNLRIGRQANFSFDQTGKDVPARDIPPVGRIEFGHAVERLPLHRLFPNNRANDVDGATLGFDHDSPNIFTKYTEREQLKAPEEQDCDE